MSKGAPESTIHVNVDSSGSLTRSYTDQAHSITDSKTNMHAIITTILRLALALTLLLFF
jgi:hypothetical protein